MDLSIILPTINEERNVAILLRSLRRVVTPLGVSYEVLVVDGGSKDNTVREAQASRAYGLPVRVIEQRRAGYGEALREGIEQARGQYVLTLDADLSHNPGLIPALWRARNSAHVVIASRYVPGGSADMPWVRFVLSCILNRFFSKFLSLPFRDLSSGFRLYQASVVKDMKVTSVHFDVLEEMLINAYANGWKVLEIPFRFRPRKKGKSKVRFVTFALSFLLTFAKIWRLRNSIECGDYDDRAYDSRIPLQRYWQRRRVGILTGWASGARTVLDIGCGSSRALAKLGPVIGVDLLMRKLRFALRFGKPLVNGSIWNIPFLDRSVDCVICSEVVEHIPAGDGPFLEMRRVLKPGGKLILGTPDYSRRTWCILEWIYARVAPGGYAHEHMTHYDFKGLKALVERLGFRVRDVRYICHSEMILLCEFVNTGT